MKIYNSFDTYFLLANLLGTGIGRITKVFQNMRFEKIFKDNVTDYHIKKKSLMTKGITIFIPPCDRNVHN